MNETPQGAIWVKNFKLRSSIANFISTRGVECPSCHTHFQDDLDTIEEQELHETITNHVMTVKLKAVREKFIAIYNPKKSLSTHPDYFLYVYQAYTGAPSVYPFTHSSSKPQDRQTVSVEGHRGDGSDSCQTTGDRQPPNQSPSGTTGTFYSKG